MSVEIIIQEIVLVCDYDVYKLVVLGKYEDFLKVQYQAYVRYVRYEDASDSPTVMLIEMPWFQYIYYSSTIIGAI